MIWVTQPALNKIASLSDLSNSIRSENIPSLSDLSNSPRSEKNTNTLRFPYIHAYQYKYRIPREYIANNKLIKVVLEKKRRKKTDPLAKWKTKAPSYDSTGRTNNR